MLLLLLLIIIITFLSKYLNFGKLKFDTEDLLKVILLFIEVILFKGVQKG